MENMVSYEVPIVILHRNEFESLFRMIEAIQQNTCVPYKLFVVDNASSVTDKDLQFARLKRYPGIHLIESVKNNWVLGFNAVFSHAAWPKDAKYYVFSDADIVVPAVKDSCWLTYLVQQMEEHACIGKLGLSLLTDDIDNIVLRDSVTAQKGRFAQNPRIGPNTIAPVDTTLAIYRNNFFVGSKFRFSVGHASLARPYYFTCRTSSAIEARHLGWYSSSSLPLDGSRLSEKIRCFALFGGYIEPPILALCKPVDRIFYKIVRPSALLFWGAKVVYKNFMYLFSKFPRNVNELQSNCR